MKNSIKLAMVLNALKNLKLSAKSGGKGSFKLKGLSFSMKAHDIILCKIDDVVKESLHKEAVEVSLGSIDLNWDFPVGYGKLEDGKMEFGCEEEASMSIVVEGLKVLGKNESFELEHISIEGVQQVKEFFMELPLAEMANLASFK